MVCLIMRGKKLWIGLASEAKFIILSSASFSSSKFAIFLKVITSYIFFITIILEINLIFENGLHLTFHYTQFDMCVKKSTI